MISALFRSTRIKNESNTEVVEKKLKQGGLLDVVRILAEVCHY